MNTDLAAVTLTTLGSGSAVELFQEQLNRVLANIMDVNTEAEDKREVSLKIVLHPNSERNTVRTEILVGAKLAPIKGASTTLFVGKNHGEVIAVEQNPKQIPLLLPEQPAQFPAPVAAPSKE